MRQQYHFKKVGDDIYIWDVNKLVDQYGDLVPSLVPLTAIREIDQPFWYEATDDIPTCRSVAEHAVLIAQADLKYPILLHPDGSVMDGMHRVCKALNLGLTDISAIVIDELPAPDYINVAAADLPY